MSDRGALEFLKGLLIGGAIGAVTALLYAPKSGRETREDLAGHAGDLLELSRREYEESLERARRAYEQAKERLHDLESRTAQVRQEVREGLKETGEKLRGTGEKLREAAHEGRETASHGASRLKDALSAAKEAYISEKQETGAAETADESAEAPATAKRRSRKTDN